MTDLWSSRRGTGEPLLWISGYGVSARSFDPVIAGYHDRFDCITFDNRGAGRSSVPWLPFSIPDMAADAVRVLDTHQVEHAIVYGTSMGGMIAQEMAVRFPHRVRGLILGATSPGGPHAARSSSADLLALLSPGGRRGDRSRGRRLAELMFSPGFRAAEPELVATYLRLVGRPHPALRGLALQAWASAFHDAERRLAGSAVPLLVLHGGDDALVPVGNAALLGALVPGASVEVLPGAGHAYWLEQPDRCLDIIRAWAEDLPAAAPARPPNPIERGAERVTRALAFQIGAARGVRSGLALAQRAVVHRLP